MSSFTVRIFENLCQLEHHPSHTRVANSATLTVLTVSRGVVAGRGYEGEEKGKGDNGKQEGAE